MSNVESLLYEGGKRSRTFLERFPAKTEFVKTYNEMKNTGIPGTISDESCVVLYYLMASRYGGMCFAGTDESTNVIQIFTTVYMYGGAWERRVKLQEELRAMSLEDLLQGGGAIYNSGQNPDTAPLTTAEDGIRISSQNRTIYRRSKLEAYGQLKALLEADVTVAFLDRFAFVFRRLGAPLRPVLYGTEEGENNGIDY